MTSVAIEPELTATAVHLLKTAERLYAVHGMDAVSTREVSREAGQKNHSALQYHFGSKDSVIDAILDFRMGPLNDRRQALLTELRAGPGWNDVRALVTLLVRPFAEELKKPPEDRYYLSLLAQLYNRHQEYRIFYRKSRNSSALHSISERLTELLLPIAGEMTRERLRMTGILMVHTVEKWDSQRRNGELLREEELENRIQDLIAFIVGALTAPRAP